MNIEDVAIEDVDASDLTSDELMEPYLNKTINIRDKSGTHDGNKLGISKIKNGSGKMEGYIVSHNA